MGTGAGTMRARARVARTRRMLDARRVARYQAARKPTRRTGYAALLEIERILDGPAPSAQDVADAMAVLAVAPCAHQATLAFAGDRHG